MTRAAALALGPGRCRNCDYRTESAVVTVTGRLAVQHGLFKFQVLRLRLAAAAAAESESGQPRSPTRTPTRSLMPCTAAASSQNRRAGVTVAGPRLADSESDSARRRDRDAGGGGGTQAGTGPGRCRNCHGDYGPSQPWSLAGLHFQVLRLRLGVRTASAGSPTWTPTWTPTRSPTRRLGLGVRAFGLLVFPQCVAKKLGGHPGNDPIIYES